MRPNAVPPGRRLQFLLFQLGGRTARDFAGFGRLIRNFSVFRIEHQRYIEPPTMSGLAQSVRYPAVAGLFYPDGPDQCRAAAAKLLEIGNAEAAKARLDFESPAVGAIVPHAGWICSGAVAAEAIAAAGRRLPSPDVVVVFGAIHTPIPTETMALDSHGQWVTPGDLFAVTTELRDGLCADRGLFAVDDRFHTREHAVEVELPLIRLQWPGAAILPIETPPNAKAVDAGRAVARRIKELGLSAVYLASSDLTHYGPNYRFMPAGIGPNALEWAMENDRKLLEKVCAMGAERVVPEASIHLNACGAGAIAAMMAASQTAGATQARVLKHTNSYRTLALVAPQTPENAVGYAAVMLG
jgi:AmmeMemoRadiSam system protein B